MVKDVVKQFEALEEWTHQAKRLILSELQANQPTRAMEVFNKYTSGLNTNLAIIRGKLQSEQEKEAGRVA